MHILLCFEGTRYAKRSPVKGFVPRQSSASLKGTERCCFWSCDLLRWEEKQESRSLGQQVSEASMTSQLYNLCSPAYKTAALCCSQFQHTGASTLVTLVTIYVIHVLLRGYHHSSVFLLLVTCWLS